jgi:hypothetical protein
MMFRFFASPRFGGFLFFALISFACCVLKFYSLKVNVWKWSEEFRKLYAYDTVVKVFVVPPKEVFEVLSFDRKVFTARLLDIFSILNRHYLIYSSQWKRVVESSLFLDRRDLNAIEVAVYQYSDPPYNFPALEKLVRENINLAKKDWKLLMVMVYQCQFVHGDIDKASFYAKFLFENPEGALVARALYPVLLSKAGKVEKALSLYRFLLKHAKTKSERKLIEEKIKELEAGLGQG